MSLPRLVGSGLKFNALHIMIKDILKKANEEHAWQRSLGADATFQSPIESLRFSLSMDYPRAVLEVTDEKLLLVEVNGFPISFQDGRWINGWI